MTHPDDDLDLKDLWQSTPPVDLTELVDHVDRERRRMRNLLWFELIGNALGVAVIWWYHSVGIFGDHIVLAVAVTAVALALQIWMWHWRRGLWQAVSQAPIDLLKLQRRRATIGLRIANYYAWGTPISTVIGGAFGATLAYVSKDDTPSPFTPGVEKFLILVIIAMIIGLTWFGVRMRRHYKAQIKALDARIEAFGEDGE